MLSQNDTPVIHNGTEVGVSMWCGAIKIDSSLRYSVLCSDFEAVIGKARESGRFEFMQ